MINLKAIFKKENPVQLDLKNQLWKILSDKNCQYLFCETRNSIQRKVNFSCVRIEKGEILWSDVSISDEEWWLSMDRVVGNRLLLFKYEDPDKPETKGIFALDSKTGKLVWEKPDYFCTNYSESGLSVQNKEGDTLMLNPYSGEEIAESGTLNLEEENFSELLLPERYVEETEYFNTVGQWIRKYVDSEPVFAIDYMEHHSHIIASVHVKTGNNLQLFLFIMNMEGEVIYQQLLENSLKGVSADTFFICNNTLIYISEKTKLNLYYF